MTRETQLTTENSRADTRTRTGDLLITNPSQAPGEDVSRGTLSASGGQSPAPGPQRAHNGGEPHEAPGAHHLRPPPDTFASSEGLRRENQNLRKALSAYERISWMAAEYAEQGGNPERRDYEEAMEEVAAALRGEP